jgi:hypothetical protein
MDPESRDWFYTSSFPSSRDSGLDADPSSRNDGKNSSPPSIGGWRISDGARVGGNLILFCDNDLRDILPQP